MSDLLGQNLEPKTIAHFNERANHHGRYLQAEGHALLEDAAPAQIATEDFWTRATALKDTLGNRPHSDSADLIREDPDER